jgi:predicted Zn-dependent protease
MKRWVALSGIVLLGVAAIWVSERRKVDVPAGPAAVLYMVADTEQELTRMPVSFTRMSDEQEIRIGDRLARSYGWRESDGTSPEFKEVESYLTLVGSRLVPYAHRKLPYKFHYIADRSFVNAFALPGGHVYVGAGLLGLMDSEDELASVLGHEMEHIDHYHCAERVQQEQALRRIPLGGLIAIPVEVFEAGYSKDQELEADREGTRLAVQAGYSANGAIRMFETFERLYQEYQTRARTPQEELSDVAQQTIAGYFRSHPLPSERIEQIQKLIASEHWELKPERNLAVAYIFWTAKANAALENHRYGEAEQLAERSLKMREAQRKALEVLARAQFAQAEFEAAAVSYRKLLNLDASGIQFVSSFAMALAASNRERAAVEFRQWSESAKAGHSSELLVPDAGLQLLAGNAEPARQLQLELTADAEGQLGWWYYEAGQYQTAADLLERAVQRLPGSDDLRVHLAWAQIELAHLNDALETVNAAYQDRSATSERSMARAVAEWQAKQPDQALQHFAEALTGQPEWGNARWVGALYSPQVSHSIQEMQAERERRRKGQYTLTR